MQCGSAAAVCNVHLSPEGNWRVDRTIPAGVRPLIQGGEMDPEPNMPGARLPGFTCCLCHSTQTLLKTELCTSDTLEKCWPWAWVGVTQRSSSGDRV